MSDSWCVYLVRCNDNSLYAGITTDITRRLFEHNSSKLGAKYTRCRRPVSIAYIELATNRSKASITEARLKKLSKEKKEQLVAKYLAKNT